MNTSATTKSRRSWLTHEPLILLALAILALYFARDILIPFAMALTFNFLLAPAVIWFERRLRFKRLPAVALVLVAATALIGGIGWVVAVQVIGVVNDLPNYRDNIHDKIVSMRPPASGPLSKTIASIQQIGEALSGEPGVANQQNKQSETARLSRRARQKEEAAGNTNPVLVTVVTPPESERQYLSELLRPVVKPLGTLGMVVVFTIYMLLKREDLRNRVLLLAGMGRLNVMTQALNDAAERISSFLIMNVQVNASYGLVFGIGLYLLHVPNATLWGVLLGILRMVPYIGTLLAGFSTVAFTLAVFNGWHVPLLVVLMFVVLEFVVSNFIEPWLYGNHTGISALALVISALVWTLLWGWWGLVLSTPMTVCLIVCGRYVPHMSFLHTLLGDSAELAPEAQFYERLLALDQTEAHAIADRFLEGHNLVELYDGVVLPALSLAEQDRHKGALDEVRATFLFQSATELIAELADFKTAAPKNGDVEAIPEPPPFRTCPIVCIPANDQADEIAATMLAQLLEQCSHKTLLIPSSALSTEILARLAEEQDTIVCISALPPFAFVHARSLCMRIRQQLPKNRIMVGLWGANGDRTMMRERFGSARPEAVATTFSEALNLVRQYDRTIVHPAARFSSV